MLNLGYFRVDVLRNALDPLLEIENTAVVSYDRDKFLFIMVDGLGDVHGLYDAYLSLDPSCFDYYFCNETESKDVDLVEISSFLEPDPEDSDEQLWGSIEKDDGQDDLVFQLGTFFDYDLMISRELIIDEVHNFGFLDRHENYVYRIVVRIFDDNFARIIHQVRQSFMMKISERQVEIEGTDIVLREENGECGIEGVVANDEPYNFLVEVTDVNLGAFLKASTLSNKVCLYINKPKKVKAMLEFHIPEVGSFMFYYLIPQYDDGIPDAEHDDGSPDDGSPEAECDDGISDAESRTNTRRS